MQNTSGKMPLDLFKQIVAKVKSENYKTVGIYSWTEPFLNLTLHEYVKVVKDAGLCCYISTTLSLRRIGHLEKVLCAGLDHMIVSMSGADEETHQRNHVGASLAYAFENLARIREIIDRHGLATNIHMRLLRFHYNADAEPILRERAAGLGFTFETIEAVGNPDIGPEQSRFPPNYFRDQVAAGSLKPLPDGTEVCPLIFDHLAVDYTGNVHLCCAFPNVDELKIGRYLDISEPELLLKRFHNPFCQTCTFPRRAPTSVETARLAAALESEAVISDNQSLTGGWRSALGRLRSRSWARLAFAQHCVFASVKAFRSVSAAIRRTEAN
jgi:MoaA/NifB/PqqE/SkfB family radical SAM enzyme